MCRVSQGRETWRVRVFPWGRHLVEWSWRSSLRRWYQRSMSNHGDFYQDRCGEGRLHQDWRVKWNETQYGGVKRTDELLKQWVSWCAHAMHAGHVLGSRRRYGGIGGLRSWWGLVCQAEEWCFHLKSHRYGIMPVLLNDNSINLSVC